ncbi:unnamed protein product [Didymodactylos carnosus]|uniref:Ricin B lectin domain-containing protein n=1 Tax=Didymodactylos carnosus TaxID=1234261 RepID=A0A814C7N9_9BILA|nr:unnamed protein product [Didymodactylos carnosus]CAF0939447.1 unnamed protein product [Didymodactylos carnosus]CAF3677016.1 unnamed protein product [Didymodactylos carnosus]CAF3716147.1 unnamed protein product [Didymodactylos carnosus]
MSTTTATTDTISASSCDTSLYGIVGLQSGKVLDVFNGSLTDQTVIVIYTKNGSDSQKWQLVSNDDGYFNIIHQLSGKALTVNGTSMLSSDHVRLVINNLSSNNDLQKWQLASVPSISGYFTIVNKHSALMANVAGASVADGAQLIMYQNGTSSNQVWQFSRFSNCSTCLTFDNIGNGSSISSVPNWYGSLFWSNVYYVNASLYNQSGYQSARTSGCCVAFNGVNSSMTVAAISNNTFDVISFVTAAVFYDNLLLNLLGFRSNVVKYNTTVTLQVETAAIIALNWMEIDKMTFSPYGGTLHFPTNASSTFAIDNLCVTA